MASGPFLVLTNCPRSGYSCGTLSNVGKASRRVRDRKRQSRSAGTMAKLSACLIELMEPYRQEYEDPESYGKLVLLASAAWNLSLFSANERTQTLARILQGLPAGDRLLAEAAITELLLRKDQRFPNDRRLIASTEVVVEGGHSRLLVASMSEG